MDYNISCYHLSRRLSCLGLLLGTIYFVMSCLNKEVDKTNR